jgi:dihydrofolate synthase/folylpolyglutamate synthase
MLKDKDMAGVVRTLDPHIDVWLVAGLDMPRGASAAELIRVLKDCGVHGAIRTCANVAEALSHACNEAGENDRIAAFGSFHTVAEAMQARELSVN